MNILTNITLCSPWVTPTQPNSQLKQECLSYCGFCTFGSPLSLFLYLCMCMSASFGILSDAIVKDPVLPIITQWQPISDTQPSFLKSSSTLALMFHLHLDLHLFLFPPGLPIISMFADSISCMWATWPAHLSLYCSSVLNYWWSSINFV